MARTVKCPGCGADLTVKDGNRDFMFCEFCGTKIWLDDYQETHRFVDEARIQESKDAKELELKKMEFEERKRKENDEFLKKNWKWFLLFFICLIAFCLFMSYITPEKESAIDRGLDIFETYVKSKG